MFLDAPRSDSRRPYLAMALSLAFNGLVVAGLLLVSHDAEAIREAPEVELLDYVEITAPTPRPTVVPAAPKAPRGPAGASPPVPTRELPTEPSDSVELLPVPDSVADDIGTGALVADAGGGPGGGGGGDGEGREDGSGTDGGGGIRAVHWTQVQVKSRVLPSFPEAARALGYTESQDCVVRLTIDSRGVPVSALSSSCPTPFLATARAAAMKWRFHPARDAGEPVSVMFDLNFRFVPR